MHSYSSAQPLNPQKMEIRDANEEDYESIVSLNAKEERQTSPMNLEQLHYLSTLSSYHKVVVIDGIVAGFILVMREAAPYENINYAWFSIRYKHFLYIDRIVVSKDFAGMKIGSFLYEDLFQFARLSVVKTVVCEYNIEPPNLVSKEFHKKLGFSEVGTQPAADSKLVSLQAIEITKPIH